MATFSLPPDASARMKMLEAMLSSQSERIALRATPHDREAVDQRPASAPRPEAV